MELLDANHQWRDNRCRKNDINAYNSSGKFADNDLHSNGSGKSRRHRKNR